MIDLRELRRLLVTEACEAELNVRQSTIKVLPQVQEPEVTALFVVDLDKRLSHASANGRVAAAVQADLQQAFRVTGVVPPKSLPHVTNGLIARVLRHGFADEARSGADFGLLVLQPLFQFRWCHDFHLERGGQRRGILVQAKRRLYADRWNQLTATQESVLPERMVYAALLRYEFEDARNTRLKEFRWNILAGVGVPDLVKWLRSGDFPEALDTSGLVAGLSMGRLGTDNTNLIDRDICRVDGAFVVVDVDWRDGEDPGPEVLRLNRELVEAESQHEKIEQRLQH